MASTISFGGKTYTVVQSGRTFELHGPSGKFMYSAQPYVERNDGTYFTMKVGASGWPTGNYGPEMKLVNGSLFLT